MYCRLDLTMTFFRPIDRAAEEQKYIYTDMTVTSAGPVGMVGQIGIQLFESQISCILIFYVCLDIA